NKKKKKIYKKLKKNKTLIFLTPTNRLQTKLSVFSLLGLSISSFCIPLCIGAVTQPSMSLARLTSRNILL
ncbi:MAG: hypothetical protein ACK573_00925, partial [Pseudanabaena sp.]